MIGVVKFIFLEKVENILNFKYKDAFFIKQFFNTRDNVIESIGVGKDIIGGNKSRLAVFFYDSARDFKSEKIGSVFSRIIFSYSSLDIWPWRNCHWPRNKAILLIQG